MKLVECIPNFSEGRRPEIVDAITASIQSVEGVQLLDQHSDRDHNRTVITFIGPPTAATEAAYAGISKAAELIDLDSHEGQHPRLGATDVVPFVPIREVTMDECVELARELGQRVAHELGIPVYLYEAAATRPDRVNLADIRRGEYEGLRASIADDSDRAPDFGPKQLGPAGATVIGARKPLIAFNVYLTTDEVEVAVKIAKHVRHSGGGLRYVKALGLLVEGQAQVSMNLTDFTRTPIHRVVEMIRNEASRYGVGVHRSELVGLTPQAALVDAAAWYLQLDELEPEQLIENHLIDATQESFLDRLANGAPTPGGGSAAAQAGATAAALVAMVGRLTVERKKYAEVEDRAHAIVQKADQLRGDLEAAVIEDAQAFEEVIRALRLPKDSDDEKAARGEALERATIQAGEVPLKVAKSSAEVLELAAEISAIGNANALSDAGVAGNLAMAAIQSAGLNVKVNAGGLADQELADRWRAKLHRLEVFTEEKLGEIRQQLRERAEIN
ncbi:MAG: glutamate formimidoyltransferase [Chloroflexi bacterium]|nr:glutamate formimidoyltransferase [Chloroflexota bacterium]